MGGPAIISLENVRTDGWFERIGESVGSFQALCDVIDERFFAFSLITGARITSLTVDRRIPENTVVEFVVGGEDDGPITPEDTQRATLGDFRRRLVHALVGEEPAAPAPKRDTDTQAIQLHLGVRYLLLAPLYGYSLQELTIEDGASRVAVLHDGIAEHYALPAFQALLRDAVREDLERVSGGGQRQTIELSDVGRAERAFEAGDYRGVVDLLGGWISPLTIFLRTPEGHTVSLETRATICRALAVLGSAYVEEGDPAVAEDVLRLGIQFAGETASAPDIYVRLGRALLAGGRPGEAIAPLRRAANLGHEQGAWLPLAEAFMARDQYCAALGALEEARTVGVPQSALEPLVHRVAAHLGDAFEVWRSAFHPSQEAAATP